ncbi:MAG: LamG-like jellyroll fold domain-containing protein, partial [Pseudomonadota bacterium]
ALLTKKDGYFFNGINSWIDFGASSDFTLNANFMACFRLKWSGAQGSILWNGNDGVSNGNTWMVLVSPNNRITFEKYGFSGTWLEGPVLTTDTWTHIAIVGESNGVSGCLYVNGNNVGCKHSGSAFNLPNPSPLVVGRRGPTSRDYSSGLINNLQLWQNKHVSESAIKGIFLNESIDTFYNPASIINSIDNIILNFSCDSNVDTNNNHHNAVMHNIIMTTDRFGRERAISFNGIDSWVDFGSSSDFTLNARFSVSLWFKSAGSYGWLMWNGYDSVDNAKTWMILVNQNGRIAIEKFGFGNTWLEGPMVIANTWTHLVAQFESNAGRAC